MWSLLALFIIPQPTDAAPPDTVIGQPCRDTMGGTGGVHLIRRDCPALDRSVQNSVSAIVENGKRAGRNCSTGIAYLRKGGRVDRLEDYTCAPDQALSSTNH